MIYRLLLVESSATMRFVLEKHAQSLGFTVDATDSYVSALELLQDQYQQFGSEYSGLLFGWPSLSDPDSMSLATTLEQSEFRDLPVVVMSTDMRAETRAWVAGRDNTAVLAWKEYQGLEPLLQRLIDVAPREGDAFAAKFDNSDIHLLVVDDSITIRYSLRDLFQMQGYRVSLAADQDEALELARKTRIDIAVLDFYLAETTGDLVCRELMSDADTGDIVCTVLTGTYSDHIIKRSLRAGAVECMFKNESSELLLSRIDAISRFVRQRRTLQSDGRLLEQIIETVAGPTLVIDTDNRIVYINQPGLNVLGIDSRTALVGQSSEVLLELDAPTDAGPGNHEAQWRRPDGSLVKVRYLLREVESTGSRVIRFIPGDAQLDVLPALAADSKVSVKPDERFDTDSAAVANSKQERIAAGKRAGDQSRPPERALVKAMNLRASSEPFLRQMKYYLNHADEQTERVSLLVLDVFMVDDRSELKSVETVIGLEPRIRSALTAIYRRPDHVAALSGNRYGFLLRHQEEPQSYLLTRKIMQLCNEVKLHEDGPTIACTASLLSLVKNASQPMGVLLTHAFKGVDLVNSRAPNQALLLDLRRMLSVYPVTETPPPH